jgi:hypothetical protein
MILAIILILAIFIPVPGWTGEPAERFPGKRSQPSPYQRVERFAPKVIMKALPDQDADLLPGLRERIRNRIHRTGYILNHPPANNYLIGSLERVLKLALSHRKHTHPIAHMGRFF